MMMSGKDFLNSHVLTFELAAKGVFRLGRCYIFWHSDRWHFIYSIQSSWVVPIRHDPMTHARCNDEQSV